MYIRGHFPSSVSLKNATFQKLALLLSSRETMHPNQYRMRLALSNGPNRFGCMVSPVNGSRVSLQNVCFLK
jgi:hypothetical protein